MDLLQEWEVNDIYDNLLYADASQWEQTRWLMYVVAQVNSRKKLLVTDVMKFPWDEGSIKKNTTITNEDIERLKKKAEEMKKYL